MFTNGNLSSIHFVKTSQGLSHSKLCTYAEEAWGQNIHLTLTLSSVKPVAITRCCSHSGLLLTVETCNEFNEMLWNPHVCWNPPRIVRSEGIEHFWVVNETRLVGDYTSCTFQWCNRCSHFDHACLIPLWNHPVVMEVLLLSFALCNPGLSRAKLGLCATTRWYYSYYTYVIFLW